MSNIFKEKLLKEIDEIPEELIPKFYKIFHLLKDELINKKNMNRNSLKGIWNRSIIDEKIFNEAKKSLFSYLNEE